MLKWKKPNRLEIDFWWELLDQCGASSDEKLSRGDFRAELKNWNTAHPQVEIRRDFPNATLLLIVALDGWETKHEKRESQYAWNKTAGYQVRMSSNAACAWTIEDLRQLPGVAEEALLFLRELQRLKAQRG